MHLTDEELFELNGLSKHHLAQCSQCNKRASILIEMRQQLAQPAVKSSMPDFSANWHSIKQAHHDQQQHKQKIVTIKTQRKATFWRFTSIALAASIAVMAFLPQVMTVNEDPLTDTSMLASWVEQNAQLQQQLEQQQLEQLPNVDLFTRVAVNQLKVKLVDIDRSLQQAYLLNSSDEKKLKLWQQRKQLVEHSLQKINNLKLKKTHHISI
jgi:hypothetical protein